VELVLDTPVAADPGGQFGWLRVLSGQGADRVDSLGVPPGLLTRRRVDPAGPVDNLDGLGGVREAEPAGHRDCLEDTFLDPSVGAAIRGVPGGNVLPRQGLQPLVQGGLIPSGA
jgi:hypothetical protein